MSSQKGNVSRSRGQKHQNSFAYKNDKHGATAQVKKANAKIHDGLCLHCKGVLEWKVKYNKYKALTQPKKCVKCSQKTVKDAYHIICKPCSQQLDLCCKCGKTEDIAIPINSHLETKEQEEDEKKTKRRGGKRDLDVGSSDEFDDEEDFDDLEEEEDEDFDSNSGPKKTQKTSAPPDLSQVAIKE